MKLDNPQIERLKQKLKEIYTFEADFELEEVKTGATGYNQVIKFGGGEKAFLKQFAFTSQEKLESICNLTKLARDNTIPAPKIIKTTEEKKQYFEFENKFYTLFPFIEGLSIHDLKENEQIRANLIEETAKTLARINNIPIPPPQEIFIRELDISNKEKKFWPDIERLEKIARELKTKRNNQMDDITLELIELQKELIAKNIAKKVEYKTNSVTHGDYHLENILFEPTGKVTCVLDWDNGGLGNWQRDLVYAVFAICGLEEGNSKKSFMQARDFVRHYSKERVVPVTPKDIEYGLWLYFRSLVLSNWAVSEYLEKNSTKTEIFIRKGSQRLNELRDNFDWYVEQFSSSNR
jgi:aminoglycoside phosphotransferase (APT) family kinase protein